MGIYDDLIPENEKKKKKVTETSYGIYSDLVPKKPSQVASEEVKKKPNVFEKIKTGVSTFVSNLSGKKKIEEQIKSQEATRTPVSVEKVYQEPKVVNTNIFDNQIEYIKTADTSATFSPQAKKKIKEYEDRSVSTETKNWTDRVYEMTTTGKDIPFAGDLVEIPETVELLKAADRLKNNKATQQDAILLNDWLQQQNRDTTFGYKVLDVVIGSAKMGAEIYATAGIYTAGKTAAKKSVKYLMSKAGKEAVEDLVKKKGIKAVATKIGYGLAGEAVRTAVLSPLKLPQDVLERQLVSKMETISGIREEEEGIGMSITKGYLDLFTEYASERGGDALGMIAKLDNPVKTKLMKTAIYQTLVKLNPGKESSITKILARAGYDGIVSEMLEERMGEVFRGMLFEVGLSDQEFKLPTMEQLAIEAVSFAIPGTISKTSDFVKTKLKDVSINTVQLTPDAAIETVSMSDLRGTDAGNTIIAAAYKAREEGNMVLVDLDSKTGNIVLTPKQNQMGVSISEEKIETEAKEDGEVIKQVDVQPAPPEQGGNVAEEEKKIGKDLPELEVGSGTITTEFEPIISEQKKTISRTVFIRQTDTDETYRITFSKDKNTGETGIMKEFQNGDTGEFQFVNYEPLKKLEENWKTTDLEKIIFGITLGDSKGTYVIPDTKIIDKTGTGTSPEALEQMKQDLVAKVSVGKKGETISQIPTTKIGELTDNEIQELKEIAKASTNAKFFSDKIGKAKVAALKESGESVVGFFNQANKEYKEDVEILRGTKGMTADDIMATYPNIQLKKDIPVKDIYGNKVEIPMGEKLTPYELKGNKILLQDGETYIVSKNQFENIKGQSKVAEGKPFAPELETVEEVVRSTEDIYEKLSGSIEEFEKLPKEVKEVLKKYEGEEPGEADVSARLEKDLKKIGYSVDFDMAGDITSLYKIGKALPTKYSQYTLPGGENYKEILIKAPDRDSSPHIIVENKLQKDVNGLNVRKIGKTIGTYPNLEEARKAYQAMDNRTDYLLTPENSNQDFKSSHWDEPNIIAHLRINDRKYNGNKVTFMEELQSDWAREGRDKGFIDPQKAVDADNYENELRVKYNLTEDENIIDNEKVPREEQLKLSGMNIAKTSGIPSHPLLKKWQELSIKRALQEAIKTNSKYFAWINGEQTSARYNLATYVKDVNWFDPSTAKTGESKTIELTPKTGNRLEFAVDKNGIVISVEESSIVDWKGKKLDEVLGKGLADKIMADKEGTLSGEGLKFGGEWANNLYDKQVKDIVEDLTGEKVEVIDMGLPVETKNVFRAVGDSSMNPLKQSDLEIGKEIYRNKTENYIITDILGDGKFKAISTNKIDKYLEKTDNKVSYKSFIELANESTLNDVIGKETFDVSDAISEGQMAVKITPEVEMRIKGEAPKIETSGKKFEEKQLPKQETKPMPESKAPTDKFSKVVPPLTEDQNEDEKQAEEYLNKRNIKFRTDIKTSDELGIKGKTKQEVKELIVQHNLSEENLLFANKIGGLPVPSIAISAKEIPLESFGEITLLGNKELITPSPTSKVYGSDIYSPRYPRITYTPNSNYKGYLKPIFDRSSKKIDDLMPVESYIEYFKDNGRRGIEESSVTKQLFYVENNKNVPTDRYELKNNAYKYADDNNYEYQNFVNEIVKNISGTEEIFMGFSPSGNRRYKSHTLENVVNIMKKELVDTEGFNYGVGNIRANLAKRFKSIKEIQANRDIIVSKDEMEEFKSYIEDKFEKISEKAGEVYTGSSNYYMDTFTQVIRDGIKEGNLKEQLNEYGFEKVNYEELSNFLTELKQAPTEYFEAKLKRAVDIGEFEAAIVPDNVSKEIINLLESKGVDVYKYSNEEDRADVVKFVAEKRKIAFRLAEDFEKNTGIKISDDQEQKIIELNKQIFGDEDIRITAQILTPDGQKALGSYRDRMIDILDGQASAVDTYYHEAVHKYFDLFTTKDEQIKLLVEAKNTFNTTDFAEAEEMLAENFINYVKTKETKLKNSKGIFERIINRIKQYFDNEITITKFYEDIIQGKAKTKKTTSEKVNTAKNITQVKSALKSVKKRINDLEDEVNAKIEVAKEMRYGLNTKDIAKLKLVYSNTRKFQEGDIETIRDSKYQELVDKVIEDIQIARPDLSEEEAFDYAMNLPTKAEESFTAPEMNDLLKRKRILDGYLVKLEDKALELANKEKIESSDAVYKEWKNALNAQEQLNKKITVAERIAGIQKPIEETTAEPKLSKVAERVFDKLLDVQKSDISYQPMSIVQDAAKATEFVEQEPDVALKIAKGLELPPPDITETAISIAMAEKARQDGNYLLYTRLILSRSMRQTRRGQEIVAEKARQDENSSEFFIKKLLDERANIVASGKKWLFEKEVTFKKVVDREVKKVKNTIDSAVLRKLESAQKLIDSLTCK